jgi:hypothetical protein
MQFEAAWNYIGAGSFVECDEGIDERCGPSSGCQNVAREGEHPDRKEHIAGPGCVDCIGYPGHRISLAEMGGCRAIQCLLLKKLD